MSLFVIGTCLALTPAFRFDDQSHGVHLYWSIHSGGAWEPVNHFLRIVELVESGNRCIRGAISFGDCELLFALSFGEHTRMRFLQASQGLAMDEYAMVGMERIAGFH